MATNGQDQTEQQQQVTPPQTAMIKPGDDAIEMGFGSGASFALLQRVATMLAQSSLVPQIYRDNLPNCIISLNMASRMRADPLMVMQNLYVVKGKPGWSAKFLIATINQSGAFTKLRYEWQGEPNTLEWGCRAWALEKATGERLDGPWITWKLANAEGWVNKDGSKWKTMPVKMFMYRAGAWFVDLYAPELSMGLPTREDLEDANDLELIETAPGVYEAAPPEEKEPENGERANTNQADVLANKLKAQRAGNGETTKPLSQPETEDKLEDEGKKEEPEPPTGEAPAATSTRQREPGEEDLTEEEQREELQNLFDKVSTSHGYSFASSRLELPNAGNALKPAKVKAQYLSQAIEAMIEAGNAPVPGAPKKKK